MNRGKASGNKAVASADAALKLVAHIVRASAQIDRTQLNNALTEAMTELFAPQLLAIYRVFASADKTMLFDCAGIGAQGPYLRNAYLAEAEFCRPLDGDPLLQRCLAERAAVHQTTPDGLHRLVLPVAPAGTLLYLIDIQSAAPLAPALDAILDGLINYPRNRS